VQFLAEVHDMFMLAILTFLVLSFPLLRSVCADWSFALALDSKRPVSKNGEGTMS